MPKRLLPLAGLLLFLPIAGFTYWPYFPLLFKHWQGDDFSYAGFVPFVSLWMGWQLRFRLARMANARMSLGLAFLGLSALLFVLGRFGGIKMLVFASMWATIVALVGFCWGNGGMRALRAPLLVGLFFVPFPPFIANNISFQLRLVSSALSEVMLRALNFHVFREGNIIDLGLIKLDVVDACSGLRYLMPTILIAILLGWLFQRRPLLRILLLAFALPVSVFSNAVRITLTGVLSRYVGPAAAEGFFHDFSGWLVYVVAFCVLVLFCRLTRRFDLPEPEAQAVPKLDWNAVPFFPQPQMLAVALALFAVLGWWSMSRENARPVARTEFREFPMTIGPWLGERQFLDDKTLKALGASDYAHAVYRNRETGNTLYLLISWYPEQDGTNSAHAPTACMLGGGWAVAAKGNVVSTALSAAEPIGQIQLEKNGVRLLANYWFDQRGRVITNEFLNKFYLFWDAMTQGRSDGALVRLELVLAAGQSVEEGQRVLDGVIAELRPILPAYVPGL